MSRQVSPSTDQVYGLQRVTRIWGVSRATIYRHRHHLDDVRRKRPGPLGAMSDKDLVAEIRQLLQDSPFHGEGYRKLWARLRFAGIRTSRRRVLRLMREHGLLAHQRVGRPHGSRAHDGRITTERVDVMWGSDLTSVMTGEGQAAVFIAVDHCSAECIGLHASRSADRFEALEPVRQAVRERFGTFAKGTAAGLRTAPMQSGRCPGAGRLHRSGDCGNPDVVVVIILSSRRRPPNYPRCGGKLQWLQAGQCTYFWKYALTETRISVKTIKRFCCLRETHPSCSYP